MRYSYFFLIVLLINLNFNFFNLYNYLLNKLIYLYGLYSTLITLPSITN